MKNIKLIFICPNQNDVFESAKFSIVENKGVITDRHGNKILDAKVAIDEPCPLCQQRHVYDANELLCPFDVKNRKQGD